MEIDLIISMLNELHQKANSAFENKDISGYQSYFDEDLTYKNADASTCNKEELIHQTEQYFRNTKKITMSYYRIKSSFENEVFSEKIVRKSVVYLNRFLFSKKQTIQTEEFFHWKKVNEKWKVIEVEIVLEEKY